MIEIREIAPGGNLKDFLNVVDTIYAGDRSYIRPLDMLVEEQLHPKKNPFFKHGDARLFTAHKNGKCVGRISASIDKEHLDRHKDETGFFGFFDTIDDEEVAKKLLEAAEAWLRRKGMKHARGPLSLSIWEELGMLVDGFDHPPVIMNPHHRPYQGKLTEAAGYQKKKDVFGWRYEVKELNARTKKAHAEIAAIPELSVRPISLRHIERDIDIVLDIFNDAWLENWGFVPATREEGKKMASDFRLIVIPDLTRIVLVDGEPAAFAIALPNLNELVRDLNGKVFPTGFLKLIYRLKVEGPKSARLVLLGIKKKFRQQRKFAALSLYLFAELNASGKRLGIEWGELGWTLEDNTPVNTAIRLMGGKAYKTYRVFERPLAG